MLDFIERYPDLQETPAQFQERCGQIALACFWKEKNPAREPAAEPAPVRAGSLRMDRATAQLLAQFPRVPGLISIADVFRENLQQLEREESAAVGPSL
jgi:hypothetical protein